MHLDTNCLETEVLADIALHGKTYRGRSLPWHYYQNVVTVRSDLIHGMVCLQILLSQWSLVPLSRGSTLQLVAATLLSFGAGSGGSRR